MKNEITFDDYQKVQISVGTVLKVSKNMISYTYVLTINLKIVIKDGKVIIEIGN